MTLLSNLSVHFCELFYNILIKIKIIRGKNELQLKCMSIICYVLYSY